MPFPSRSFALLAAALVAACAAHPARDGAMRTATGDAEAAALYTRLEADSRRYAAGIELLRAGDAAKAQADIKGALDDLRDAATRCAEIPACDQQRFVAAFDALLRQGVGGAGDLPDGEARGSTPEATAGAG